MKIVVIGGTGLIGSKVVSKLTQRGHEVLAAAPNTGASCLPLTVAHKTARPGGDSVASSGGISPICRRIMALSK